MRSRDREPRRVVAARFPVSRITPLITRHEFQRQPEHVTSADASNQPDAIITTMVTKDDQTKDRPGRKEDRSMRELTGTRRNAPELTDVNLTKLDLIHVNFTKLDLTDVNLTELKLSEFHFSPRFAGLA
eukprot:gene20403-27182_t